MRSAAITAPIPRRFEIRAARISNEGTRKAQLLEVDGLRLTRLRCGAVRQAPRLAR